MYPLCSSNPRSILEGTEASWRRELPWGIPRFGRREGRPEGPLTGTLAQVHTLAATASLASQPWCSLTFLAVVPVLVEPVPVPTPAQVAPRRVDALVLAPAVVLGALVLVCGDRQALRGNASLGNPSHLRTPLRSSLCQEGSLIALMWGIPFLGWTGAAPVGWYLVLLYLNSACA